MKLCIHSVSLSVEVYIQAQSFVPPHPNSVGVWLNQMSGMRVTLPSPVQGHVRLLINLRHLCLLKQIREPSLYVVHVAVEMAPICKVGGLGDVVTALGRAVQEEGNMVEVVLPRCDSYYE
jgi:hypothetical protein